METPAEAADPAARTFSQVVFMDIPHSYPPATRVICRYSVTEAFRSTPRDWVGIFKVGWSTTKDYHTFVWAELGLDVGGQQSLTRQAVFEDYYLPKDDLEFYQFCYIDSTGKVRGASTPFCFRTSEEQSVGSSSDYDLLVVTTQEQVEQSVQEKAELQIKLDQIMEENETLKRVLQKEQKGSATLKEQNEQRDKERSQLVQELGQVKEQNENLKRALQQQQRETERLQETLTMKQTETLERNAAEQKQSSLDGASRQKEKSEKYERAVMKINQLKEEREELRARVDAQSEQIATLTSKIREDKSELFKMKDSIQLLQFDLQSSEKEKHMLSLELQRLQSHMDKMVEECRSRSSEPETQQNRPDDDLMVRCQTLEGQLQEAQERLMDAREESKNGKRRVKMLEGDLLEAREELKNVILLYEEAKQRSDKKEHLLREAYEAIEDKAGVIEQKDRLIDVRSREIEELTREKQNLASDIEELRRVNANSANSPYETDTARQQPGTPEHLYDSITDVTDPEEEPLVCRHCQERFPLITQEELKQHEQSHRLCPICMMTCDSMEQPVFEDHVYSHEL